MKKFVTGGLDLKYKEVEHHDIEAVKLLHDAVFPLKYDKKFYDSLLNNERRHTIMATIAARNGLGYEIIGVLSYRIKKGRFSIQRITEWWNGFSQGSHAYIMTFGVAPAFRRRGVGSFLLLKALEQMKACDLVQLSLHVQRDNEAALRFYLDFGFSIVCNLPHYYNLPDSGAAALWLRKDLNKVNTFDKVFAPAIRDGPWPFGLSFELFVLLVLALATIAAISLATLILSR